MEKDLELKDILNPIIRNKKLVFKIVLSILILTLIATSIWPKTYESTSVIQLARLDTLKGTNQPGGEIFLVIEARSIILSTSILMPAVEKYLDNKTSLDKFTQDHIEISILKEVIGRDQKPINYLQVKVKYPDPRVAQIINQKIVDQFFNYSLPYYDRAYGVLSEDLSETTIRIAQLEKDIKNVQNQIEGLSNQQLSTEGVSKSTLLTSILNEYSSRLTTEEISEITLKESIANRREFQLISEPQIPKEQSSPDLLINLIIALVASIFISLIGVYFKEGLDY